MMQSVRPVLQGLRILEIGHFVAAPFATRILADLGADVIKIEPPTGDPVRAWGERIDGKSLWWSCHGRGKRCITLNLKDQRGKDILLDLVRQSDAVVENFRPGQLTKLGIGPEVLRGVRPDLIIAHVSGYGQTGPYRDRAAFGVIGEAMGGLRYLTDQRPGTSDLPPVRVGVSIGDSIAGLYAAIGVLAAVWQRDRNGGDGLGRTLDVALTESVLSLMEGMLPEYGALGKIKQPTGGGIATAAPTNAYPASDGWLLIAANSEPLFAKLMRLIGRGDLIGTKGYSSNPERVENSGELDRIIGEWTRKETVENLLATLAREDIPSSKVFTAADCAQDEQYLSRGMVREVMDETIGRPVLHYGIVPHVVEGGGDIRWAGPELGAHNVEILNGLLGIPIDEIDLLKNKGVI